MSVQQQIESKLQTALTPFHLEVINESHMHNVAPGSESHFKVTVVAEQFTGQAPLARHRSVNKILAQELAGAIHALALHTLTPDEWHARGARVPVSPPCAGGAK